MFICFKTTQSKKRLFILFVIFILSFQLSACANTNDRYTKAKVTHAEVTSDDSIVYSATILEGTYKGNTFTQTYSGMKYTILDYPIKKGAIILISTGELNGKINISIKGVYRNKYIRILAVLFVIILLLFGRKIGLASLFSLFISGLCIFCIYIPLILRGFDIILAAVLCCVLIVTISFIIIAGITKKSISAILGTLGGLLCAFLLIKFFSERMCITGAASEEVYLLVFEQGVELDFSKVFVSGVIIGTIGVLMDVSMSISSVIFEIKEHSPYATYSHLVGSGLNVGKDVMATMINTLILAYAGTAMPMFLWLLTSEMSLNEMINLEETASEILRGLCGSIGLILSVPITSVVASYTATTK